MLGPLLLVFICSAEVAGSVPFNLFINDENFSGSWELSPSSADQWDRIIIVPAGSQSRSGYAWRLRKSPHELWSMGITFEVTDRVGLTQGAVFITEEFGAFGDHFGGPAKFEGAAIIFEIVNNTISYEYRINNGLLDYTNTTIMPHLTVDLPINIFTIKAEFTYRSMVHITSCIQNQNVVIYYGRTRIGNPKAWVSVNAYCPLIDTEFSVLFANMSYEDEKVSPIIADAPIVVPSISVKEFDPSSGLQHHEFNRLSRVMILARDKQPVKGDADAVFEGILEINEVIQQSSKLYPTKKVIEHVMHNYTDSWKRRSLRMISETETLRSCVSNEASSLSFLIEDFRWSVGIKLTDLRERARSFGNSLIEGIREIATQMAELKKLNQVTTSLIVKLLIGIGIIEVVMLGIYGVTPLLVKKF